VISFSGDKITAVDVTNALGFAGVEILKNTINAIAARDPRAILAVVDDLIARGHDLRNFCRDVLGLCRDLLVFKVAGEDARLFESAVFSSDDMRAMAGPFSEADLVRFFSSLCETEASLREAAHPRYVLEIGLVELIEMRSVASLENILERLDAISSGAPLSVPGAVATGASTAAESSSAATASVDASEKKTLKPEARSAVESDTAIEPSDEVIGFDVALEPAAAEVLSVPAKAAPSSTPYPVRLPPLSSLELEHIEEPRLDDAYEERLLVTGDDLRPIRGVEKLVESFIGRETAPITLAATGNGGGSAGTAAARAFAPAPQPIAEPVDLRKLSDDPTEEELEQYALAHPSIQAAIRIFRAKIVSVTKR
jgi:DNA polymerase-3 subunit gamma/tau